MADKLRLDIEPPLAGWATVRLTAPGGGLEFAASYTPRDSIGELAQAVAGLLAGLPEQIILWNTEPDRFSLQKLLHQVSRFPLHPQIEPMDTRVGAV